MSRQALWVDWWSTFIPEFRAAHPGWLRSDAPPPRSAASTTSRPIAAQTTTPTTYFDLKKWVPPAGGGCSGLLVGYRACGAA